MSVSKKPRLPPALDGTLALLALLPRVSVGQTVLLAGATLFVAILPVATVISTGLLVGIVPGIVASGLVSGDGQAALRLFLLASALVLINRAVGPFQTALATTFARQVDRHLQERVMAAVARPAGIGHLEDPATLDLIRNAQGVGAEGLHPGDAVRALATLVPSWLQALGSAVILVAFRPGLGVLWLSLWPIVLYFLQREYVRVGQTAGVYAAAVRRSDYLRDLALTPTAAKEVRVWGMLDWLIEAYDRSWLAAMAPVWQTRRPGRPILWLATGAVTLADFGSLMLLAAAAIQGDLGLGALAVYLRAVLDASAFRAFDDPNAHLAYAAVSVPAMLELERRMNRAPSPAPDAERTSPPTPSPGAPGEGKQDGERLNPNPLSEGERAHLPTNRTRSPSTARAENARGGEAHPIRDAISFDRVSFHYPGQTTAVLEGLDLVIPAGRSLAIVGANGAGKTTLIKLLCRMYEPTSGRIAVDGIDLRQTEPRHWQRQVAAIFQDFVSYHLSARDNIALGAPEHAGDATALRLAAERAGALDLIEALPRGWDTILSRQYVGGVDLSGGQWQRIALARALFAAACGARVLILDEPTASLDVRAEAAMYDRFLEITAGLTTIVISHRFSTVRRAERIVVVAGGRVAESGSHDELVVLGGTYATMFALQAARFADDGERESDRGEALT